MPLIKTTRVSLWGSLGGLLLAAIGVSASGGFGPCGPQHAGPFLLAMLGVAIFGAGFPCFIICSGILAVRKLKTSGSKTVIS